MSNSRVKVQVFFQSFSILVPGVSTDKLGSSEKGNKGAEICSHSHARWMPKRGG